MKAIFALLKLVVCIGTLFIFLASGISIAMGGGSTLLSVSIIGGIIIVFSILMIIIVMLERKFDNKRVIVIAQNSIEKYKKQRGLTKTLIAVTIVSILAYLLYGLYESIFPNIFFA